jgi:hypothetical protein
MNPRPILRSSKRNEPELEVWGLVGDELLEFPFYGRAIVRAPNSEEFIDVGIEVLGVASIPMQN